MILEVTSQPFYSTTLTWQKAVLILGCYKGSCYLLIVIAVTNKEPTYVTKGLYANTAHRDWESDSDLKNSNNNVYACTDIADQLINGPVGKNFHVILGGGAAKFLPTTAYDSDGIQGNRTDGRNLIQEWQSQNESVRQFIWNKARLLNISSNVKHLLGLFSSDHMPFNLERDTLKVPSLAEMTESAIKLLSQNTDGYFLFVEGGRIDHAHHKSQARKALDETVQFHEAVKAALHITNRHDTLIITTSDHAHTMSINGYPLRGNDILGIGGIADDDLPYTTLTYANGPGYRMLENGHRQNVSNDNFDNQNYAYSAGFPLVEETHGGEDVAIFALGPWAHLFVGVLEQNVIPHIMAFASCVGNGIKACDVNVNTN